MEKVLDTKMIPVFKNYYSGFVKDFENVLKYVIYSFDFFWKVSKKNIL